MPRQSNSTSLDVDAPERDRQLKLDLSKEGPDGSKGGSKAGELSHELMTPLAVIMGALQTLDKHDQVVPYDKRRRLLEMAIESGWELNSVIDSLLQSIGDRRLAVGGERPRVIQLPLD